MEKITKDIEIEDLVDLLPEAVSYLRDQKIRCLRCGEPIWGTLEKASEEKGYSREDIDRFVDELNSILEKK
ncbi:MAG: DUF1858 domain-containing protein [Melioribacteraceae bacterium]|nr:DUF1858 domain-containing protein [Melioribacteraceae bacterium]